MPVGGVQLDPGVVRTVATLCCVGALGLTPLRIENPTAILFLPVLYAAVRSGIRSGQMSAALVVLFAAWYFSVSGHLFHYTPVDLGRLALLAGAMPLALAIVAHPLRRVASARMPPTPTPEARRAVWRRAFLAEAATLLDTSLDYETTLASIARLAVPNLADYCIVDILQEESGHVRRMAVAHTDPAKEQMVWTMQQLYPEEPHDVGALPRVMRTGASEMFARITDAHLKAAARDDRHLTMLRALGYRSAISAPLGARGRTLGAIHFIFAESRRRYVPDDIALAEDLASRAALAVDNAILYRAANQEITERKRAEAHVEALNERLRRAMTETHHRVKNNLQLVAAMVDMRVMDDTETVPTTELRRLTGYIRTLAAVHDILTKEAREDGQASSLSTRAVLESLLALMKQTAGDRTLAYSIGDAQLSSRQGTSLALVTNELVSNALKHSTGSVDVRFSVEDGRATLEVLDDGPGFPPDFDVTACSNVGLELVENLTRWDLAGLAHYGRQGASGGRAVVMIPISELPEH